jgi:hypothetical protein
MYIVYKTTGFGLDTFYANLLAFGENYINIFINFNKRLFNWIFDLFDHKVVPNTPSSPSSPSSWSNYSNKNLLIPEKDPLENTKYIRNLLKDQPNWFDSSPSINVTIDSTPWYKDISTWLLIGGVLSLLGIGYLGYSYIFSSTSVTSPTSDTTITRNNIEASTSIKSIIINNIKKLNPLHWFLSSDTDVAHTRFIETQQSSDYDNRFYPFTQADPFKPWYSRLRILLFGETASEIDTRMHAKDIAFRTMMPTNFSGSVTSGSITPSIGIIGLGTPIPSGSGFMDNVTNSFSNISSKFNTVPSTPKGTSPAYLPPLNMSDVNPFETTSEQLTEALKNLSDNKSSSSDSSNVKVPSPTLSELSNSFYIFKKVIESKFWNYRLEAIKYCKLDCSYKFR